MSSITGRLLNSSVELRHRHKDTDTYTDTETNFFKLKGSKSSRFEKGASAILAVQVILVAMYVLGLNDPWKILTYFAAITNFCRLTMQRVAELSRFLDIF